MTEDQLKGKILKVLDQNKIGTLATIIDGKPHSRYMTFFHDGLKLYTATSKRTDKVEEIQQDPDVHILLGYVGEGFGDSYLEIAGKAVMNDSEELKKAYWNDHLKPWFEGPDDPNYTIAEIHPTSIRLMNNQGHPPEELNLK